MPEGIPGQHEAPVFEIDVSKGWDFESQVEIFIRKLKKLPFYRSGLLYSGFNAAHIGKSFSSKSLPGNVFCEPEENFQIFDGGGVSHNPFEYALGYENPAIAVYDPAKLQKVEYKNAVRPREAGTYRVKEPSALLGIIKIKVQPIGFIK